MDDGQLRPLPRRAPERLYPFPIPDFIEATTKTPPKDGILGKRKSEQGVDPWGWEKTLLGRAPVRRDAYCHEGVGKCRDESGPLDAGESIDHHHRPLPDGLDAPPHAIGQWPVACFQGQSGYLVNGARAIRGQTHGASTFLFLGQEDSA